MEVDTSNECNENNGNRNDTQLTQPLANLSPMDSSEAALLGIQLHQIDGERKVENALLLKRPDLKGLSLIFTFSSHTRYLFGSLNASRPSPYFHSALTFPPLR